MGWLWGANEAKAKPSTSNSNNDPLRDLDPSLRDFLQTESPSAQNPSPPTPSSSSKPPSEPKSVPVSSSPTPNSSSDAPSSSTPLPAPPMVYSDGRYADLWSSYRPRGVIEEEVKSDQEKLADVLEIYKERKALIGRAALENCALEQSAWSQCLSTGGFVKRMNLCRAEHKSFERCYVMQAKFLRALGYLATSRSGLVEEQIQMHADTLYHRMLAQEAAIAEAKASNAPIPTFAPIMSPFSTPSASSSSSTATTTDLTSPPSSPPPSSSTSPSPTEQPDAQPLPPRPYLPPRPIEEFSKDHLKPAARAALQKHLKDLPPEAREVEERAVAMEASQTDAIGRTIENIVSEHERKRRERREKGEAGITDWISSLFGR